MRFAKWVFLLAGASGVLMVAPLYWEDRFFQDYPPAINRPEFYHGFTGVTLAWQVMYLLIGTDPVRYRTAMLVAALAKASFALATLVLYALERVPAIWVGFASMDAAWVVLFLIAYLRTPKGPLPDGRP